MELSFFLAKLLGLYFLSIGAIWMVRKKHFETYLKEIVSSKPLMVLSGSLSLLVGLAMVISHSIWQMNWIGLITLLGYLAVVKGILRCAYPEKIQKTALHLIQKTHYWLVLLFLVLGGYLTYSGFTV